MPIIARERILDISLKTKCFSKSFNQIKINTKSTFELLRKVFYKNIAETKNMFFSFYLSQETGVAVTLGKIFRGSAINDVTTCARFNAGRFWLHASFVDDVTGWVVAIFGYFETKYFGKSLLHRGETSRALAPFLLYLDCPLPLKEKHRCIKDNPTNQVDVIDPARKIYSKSYYWIAR